MARRYNNGGTDPWSLSAQANKQYAETTENMRQEQVKAAQAAQKPDQIYQNSLARGQAKFDTAQTFREAGLNPNGTVPKNVNSLKQSERIKTPFAQEFMATLQEAGITNPNALAAIAATVDHESGWSRVHGEWNDPSTKGVPGRSGLAMSWRDERLRAARNFARQNGDNPNAPSARTQAKFFLQEDPGLIQRLNGATDLASAVDNMRRAWRYADPNGAQTKARFATAQQYLPHVGGPRISNREAAQGQASLAPQQEVAANIYFDDKQRPYTMERIQSSKLASLNRPYATNAEMLGKYGADGPYQVNPDGVVAGGFVNVRNYLAGEIAAKNKQQIQQESQAPEQVNIDTPAETVDNTSQNIQPSAPKQLPKLVKTPGMEDNVGGTVKQQVRRHVKEPENVGA